MNTENEIAALREALRHSPDNLPLRRHLAEVLTRHGRHDEAEQEFRAALAAAPDDADLQLGLADAFRAQAKASEALVVIEELLKRRDTPPRAYLVHAYLLKGRGEIDRAVRAYKNAVTDDPTLADADLEDDLGIDADDEYSEVVDGRVRAPEGMDGELPDVDFERPDTGFKDVGGMESVKEEIRLKIIHPLDHPELYEAYGKKIGGGILLYGPPGCGKTHIARATAGEVQAGFLAIGIHDVLDMWIGQSERNLHEIFEHARRNQPCVLFFDEVDALGASRADMKQSASKQTINQFLSELDGVKSSNEGVLIMAATNAPWHLDSAFRRPGRFDRIVFVPPPDEAARDEIFRIHLREKPTESLDYGKLAAKTKGFSGADIRGIVDRVIEHKLRDAMAAGVPKPISTKDILAVVKKQRASTKEWFATARNYALYSNQGGIYDDLLPYLNL